MLPWGGELMVTVEAAAGVRWISLSTDEIYGATCIGVSTRVFSAFKQDLLESTGSFGMHFRGKI